MLRRLLLAGGGSSFVIPPSVPFAVGPSGSFGWNDLHSMQYTAAYYNGRTYWTYLKSDGHVAIRYWDHATETASSETDLGFIEADLHAAPVLLVRDIDKRIMVWYCEHNGSEMWQRISTNPEDISAFGSAVDLVADIGSGVFTYPMIHQLTGETNDPLYLFFRNENTATSGWSYSTSTDGGANWSAMTSLWRISGSTTYATLWQSSPTRLDLIASDGAHDLDTDVAIYHLYWSAGAWHDTDGTTLASPPFDTSDATLVYSGTNDGAEVAGVVGGSNPAAVFRVWVTYGDPGDQRYWYSRWDGAAWDAQELVSIGAASGGGGVTMDPTDPSRVLLVRQIDGEREVELWTTSDNGATWSQLQLTAGSSAQNTTPIPVREANVTLQFMWANGTTWAGAVPMGWGP